MKRREFIRLVGGAALTVRRQQSERARRDRRAWRDRFEPLRSNLRNAGGTSV